MPSPRSVVLAALAGLAFSPAAASAHAIESSLSRLEGVREELMLQSSFSSGQPTVGALVRLVSPAGTAMELGRTDAQGHLSFTLPRNASGDWELQVDGGPGHRDYLEMPVQAGRAELDQISEAKHGGGRSSWLAGLGGLGTAAMLLGLQRIRRPR